MWPEFGNAGRRGLEWVKSAKSADLTVTRGDVWLAALDPTVGSEIQKTRPCVIISPPEMHDHLRMVAPMTMGGRHLFGSRQFPREERSYSARPGAHS